MMSSTPQANERRDQLVSIMQDAERNTEAKLSSTGTAGFLVRRAALPKLKD
jgi:hypothetical protein